MKMELGRNIRTLRLENRMTQEQMAEALGVSAGAVYKWESERSAPEVGMLVELAQLFEVSVDALLGYGWEKEGMGATAEHLRELIHHRRLDEGISYGEKALRKYPNSFEVVYRSAQLYFLSMKPERMLRAVELFRKALDLIDQNNDEKISIATIYTDIAYCLCVMGRKDEAVELLCRNNAGGMNDGHIGLLLAQMGGRETEALEYLSNGLLKCHEDLHNICVGYANAYAACGELERVTELVTLVYELGQGLRDGVTPSCVDWCNMKLLLILSETDLNRGDDSKAREHLRQARDTAEWIDGHGGAASGVGVKFYHRNSGGMVFDDMGTTAMKVIETYFADEHTDGELCALWKQMEQEGSI